jgi:hypothetical protein
MNNQDEEVVGRSRHIEAGKQPLVVRVTDHDFQRDVIEKLGRLETKMDMIVGGMQPGRMTLAENRIVALEKNDVRRGVYERLVNAAITIAISTAIAFHERLGIRW